MGGGESPRECVFISSRTDRYTTHRRISIEHVAADKTSHSDSNYKEISRSHWHWSIQGGLSHPQHTISSARDPCPSVRIYINNTEIRAVWRRHLGVASLLISPSRHRVRCASPRPSIASLSGVTFKRRLPHS